MESLEQMLALLQEFLKPGEDPVSGLARVLDELKVHRGKMHMVDSIVTWPSDEAGDVIQAPS